MNKVLMLSYHGGAGENFKKLVELLSTDHCAHRIHNYIIFNLKNKRKIGVTRINFENKIPK